MPGDGRPGRHGPDPQDEDPSGALIPRPPVVPDGVPVGELVDLTPPEQVARAALARAKAAARARGLYPGAAPRGRATPAVSSGARPGARDPQLLGATAQSLARDLGWEPGLVVGEVQHRWRELVGRDVAEHCEFVSLEQGLLTLRADSTTWAATVRMYSPTMLARFSEAFGEDTVLEVKVLGPSTPGFGRGPRRVQGRGPRDTWG